VEKYGEFINGGREYKITRKPPRPWCNILANENFGSVMTDSYPSLTWAENSREYKLTIWDSDYLDKMPSEELFFTDTGESLFSGVCIHGLGYSIYEGKDYKLTAFVPKSKTKKIYLIEFKKEREVAFSIYPCLGAKPRKRHIEIAFENNILLFRNNYSENFSHLETYITSNQEVSFEKNSIITKGKEVVFELGATGKGQVTPETLETATELLEEIQNCWKELLPEPKKMHNPNSYFLNYWLPYQTISSRIFARTGFYQVSGAYGFRDQLQDCMNIVDLAPELLKKQIILSCQHQYVEGDVQHWWHNIPNNEFHAHNGVRTKITDDRLFLPLAVAEYIEATGDKEILETETHFIESEPLNEQHERYELPKVSEEKASVLEHCKRAIEVSLNFGEHGLPLIGGGDWNDGLSNVGLKGKGESVWLGWFLIYVIEKFKLYADYTEYLPKLKEACNNAWDGEWFLRGYYDNEEPLGSKASEECKIDAISQCWAVISGAGEPEKVKKAMQSVEEYLIDKEERIIKLLTPPFQNTTQTPGYIKSYLAGVRENGGQYSHAAAWVIWALYKIGEIEKAKELWEMILPINRKEEYGAEPYVMAADIYSGLDVLGVGGWSWYTGASGWMYRIGKLIFNE